MTATLLAVFSLVLVYAAGVVTGVLLVVVAFREALKVNRQLGVMPREKGTA